MTELSSEIRYRLLKTLEAEPELSQRELSHRLGISLGKVNYCLNALIGRGLVKVRNFRDNHNKLAYMYLLTPHGIEEKARVTYLFLREKLAEVERLQAEIEAMRGEAVRARRDE